MDKFRVYFVLCQKVFINRVLGIASLGVGLVAAEGESYKVSDIGGLTC